MLALSRTGGLTIQLRRKPACRFDHRPMEVVVDGQCVSTITSGQDKVIELERGEHLVLVRVGPTSSQELSVTRSHGDRQVLECGVNVPSLPFWTQMYLVRLVGFAVAMVGACILPEGVRALCQGIVAVQVVVVATVAVRCFQNRHVSEAMLYLRNITCLQI